jgi:hypothetical protein
MTREAQNSGRPSVPVSSKRGIAYNRELAIGTILVVVVLILLFGLCIATTMPASEREMGSPGARENVSKPKRAGGNGAMTLQQAIQNAL